MNKDQWLEGLDHLDPDIVEGYILQKQRIKKNKSRKTFWLRFSALAACTCIVFALFLIGRMSVNESPGDNVIGGGSNDVNSAAVIDYSYHQP